VFILYLLGATGGLLSLIVNRLPPLWGYIIFSLIAVSGLALLLFFEKLPYERQELK